MTGVRVTEGVLWTAGAAGLAALGLALSPLPPFELEPVRPVSRDVLSPGIEPSDSLANVVVSADVFRRDRRPATERFQALVPAEAEASVGEVIRPVLTLVGIVTGSEPTAIVEGLPGTEGPRVVRAGERIGVLQVRRIRGATVEIAGMDTLWVLTVREPW